MLKDSGAHRHTCSQSHISTSSHLHIQRTSTHSLTPAHHTRHPSHTHVTHTHTHVGHLILTTHCAHSICAQLVTQGQCGSTCEPKPEYKAYTLEHHRTHGHPPAPCRVHVMEQHLCSPTLLRAAWTGQARGCPDVRAPCHLDPRSVALPPLRGRAQCPRVWKWKLHSGFPWQPPAPHAATDIWRLNGLSHLWFPKLLWEESGVGVETQSSRLGCSGRLRACPGWVLELSPHSLHLGPEALRGDASPGSTARTPVM